MPHRPIQTAYRFHTISRISITKSIGFHRESIGYQHASTGYSQGIQMGAKFIEHTPTHKQNLYGESIGNEQDIQNNINRVPCANPSEINKIVKENQQDLGGNPQEINEFNRTSVEFRYEVQQEPIVNQQEINGLPIKSTTGLQRESEESLGASLVFQHLSGAWQSLPELPQAPDCHCSLPKLPRVSRSLPMTDTVWLAG